MSKKKQSYLFYAKHFCSRSQTKNKRAASFLNQTLTAGLLLLMLNMFFGAALATPRLALRQLQDESIDCISITATPGSID
jgi:hypothetical protein